MPIPIYFAPALGLFRAIIKPVQEKLNLRRQRRELAPKIAGLSLANQIVLWKIVTTHGMNEPQIKAFADSNGLAMPQMSVLSDKTLFLAHDFSGQWKVKDEVSSAVKAEIEKRLGPIVKQLKFQAESPTLPLTNSLASRVAPIHLESSFQTVVPFNTGEGALIPHDWNSQELNHYHSCLERHASQWTHGRAQGPGMVLEHDRAFFVAELLQYCILHFIDELQKERIAARVEFGVGTISSFSQAIRPPEMVLYPSDELLRSISGNRFITEFEREYWQARRFKVPKETVIDLVKMASGRIPMRHSVRFLRPSSFELDVSVEPGLLVKGVPIGFGIDPDMKEHAHSYQFIVRMQFDLQADSVPAEHVEQYRAWAESLFAGLRKRLEN